MSLTVFLLLSAVLAVAVGMLASLLLRSLMKDQRRLESNAAEFGVTEPVTNGSRSPDIPGLNVDKSKMKNGNSNKKGRGL